MSETRLGKPRSTREQVASGGGGRTSMKLHAGSRMLGLGLVAAMLLLATLACSIAAVTTISRILRRRFSHLLAGDERGRHAFQPDAVSIADAAAPGDGDAVCAAAHQHADSHLDAVCPAATPLPYDVRISYPSTGARSRAMSRYGQREPPRFLQYALEWGPEPNPSNLWYPITAPRPVRCLTVFSARGIRPACRMAATACGSMSG